jgi:hypothetical protein
VVVKTPRVSGASANASTCMVVVILGWVPGVGRRTVAVGLGCNYLAGETPEGQSLKEEVSGMREPAGYFGFCRERVRVRCGVWSCK